MGIRNWYNFIGLVFLAVAASIQAFYVARQQLDSVKNGKRGTEKYQAELLRKPIVVDLMWFKVALLIIQLTFLVMIIIGIPSGYLALFRVPANNWAKVAAITNRLGFLIASLGFAFFYYMVGLTQKKK